MDKNLLRQAQELQARFAKAQSELESQTVEASSGGGAVKVVIDGKMNIRSIKIDPEVVVREETDMLEDLVIAAVNEAVKKSQEMAASKLGSLTGGLKIPGIM